MQTTYSDQQLDALRELANIGSGTAATALSTHARHARSTSRCRLRSRCRSPTPSTRPARPDTPVTAVVLPIFGDIDAIVLLLFPPEDATVLCGLLGVEADTEVGLSALAEIGNILGSAYVGALGMMTGLEIEPSPPESATDMLGAIVATVLASRRRGDRHRALPRLRPLRRGRGVLALVHARPEPRRHRPGSRRAGSRRVSRERLRRRWCAWASLPCPGRRATCSRRSGSARASGSCSSRPSRPLAGLAHIMLPVLERRRSTRPRASSPTGPCRRSSRRWRRSARLASRLEAVLVGGARMFSFGSSDDPRHRPPQRGGHARRARAPRHRGAGGRDRRQQGPHGSRARGSRLVTVKEPGAAEVELFAPGLGSARRRRMTDVLTPEQIAELVAAAKDGDVPTKAARARPAGRAASARSTSPAR